MQLYPAVVVHGLADARRAMARGQPVTLLSAPGAGVYAGCLWWQVLVARVRREYPDVPVMDVLDCADASGQALAALRIGLTRLVLAPDAPGRLRLELIARGLGAHFLSSRPREFSREHFGRRRAPLQPDRVAGPKQADTTNP